MRMMSARGIESEAQIPFASLLELLRPALAQLGRFPSRRRSRSRPHSPCAPLAQERFAVGAATLSLLAALADDGPLLLLIDDAHWLDGSSAQALLFAVRRLLADPIAVLIAVREGEPSLLDGADLSTLHLTGLSSADAAALLSGLARHGATAVSATAGNPLALLELAAAP